MSDTNTEKCLIEDCSSPAAKRGLCNYHSNEYLEKRKEMPKDKRDAYDELLIKRKQLLPKKRPGPTKTKVSVFDIAAADVLQTKQEAAKIAKEIKKATKNR